MSTQWVVIADRSRARVFQTEGNLDGLHEVQDLLNPQGRLSNAELRRDAKGRYYGKGERNQAHTAEPRISRQEHDEEMFSRELSQLLERGCDDRRYDSLVVIAPPEFLGMLRKQLPKRVEQRVTLQLDTGLANWGERDIRAYLKQHLH